MTDHPTMQSLLAETVAPDVVAHLASCPRCRVDRRMLRQPVDPSALDGLDVARLEMAEARVAGATTVDERWEATSIGPEHADSAPPGLLAAGRRIERYEVEALLGTGGMAVVYRVRHTRLGSLHALKVLTHASPSVSRRLLQEGQVQSALRHPHVVTVTDVVDVDGAPGLVMEYVDGPTLAALLHGHRLDLPSADRLALQIIDGVAAAHRAGLVHRDLKPGNVLIDTTGGQLTAKVSDFGIAKLADHSVGLTGTRMSLGTPSYMAPEQVLDSKRVDERADLFALGACLYELVTGQRAFLGASSVAVFNRIIAGRYVPPEALVPELPERMARAIGACLTVDRDARVPSCEALLDLWTGGEPAPATGEWDPALVARARALTPAIPLAATTQRLPWDRVLRPVSLFAAAAVLVLVSLGVGAGAGWLAGSRAPAVSAAPVVSESVFVQRHFELGWEQLMLGDLDGARRSFALVIEREPAEPYPVVVMAFAHDLAGDTGSALELLDRKRHVEDGGRAGAEQLRLYHRGIYPYPDIQGWDALLEAHPDDLLTSALAARVWSGKRETRVALYERALAQDPAAYGIHLALAEAYHQQRRWDGERRSLELVLQMGAAPDQARSRLLKHYLDAGHLQRSFAHEDLLRPGAGTPELPELRLRRQMIRPEEHHDRSWIGDLPARDQVRILREYAALELGYGRWSTAREASSRCVAVARDAGLWADALLCAQEWVRLALVVRQPQAVEEATTAYRDLAVLPEVPRELGERARGMVVYLDARLAFMRGDTDEGRRQRDRLVALDIDRCGWTTCHQLERQLDILTGEGSLLMAGSCLSRLWQYREVAQALRPDEDYPAGSVQLWTGLLAEPGDPEVGRLTDACPHAGVGRFARAEARLRLAQRFEGTEEGAEHLTAFHDLWPAPDPDLPLVVSARALSDQ